MIKVCYPGDDNKVVERIDLVSLPFISEYKILSWRGAANGGALTPAFTIGQIQNKIMIIKSFSIYNYYHAASVDLYVNDGITTNAETIPALGRIDRLFDTYTGGTTINFRINNIPVSFFQSATGISFPADLDLQNIFYKFPFAVQSIDLGITTVIFSTIVGAGATANPDVKVIMETYLV